MKKEKLIDAFSSIKAKLIAMYEDVSPDVNRRNSNKDVRKSIDEYSPEIREDLTLLARVLLIDHPAKEVEPEIDTILSDIRQRIDSRCQIV